MHGIFENEEFDYEWCSISMNNWNYWKQIGGIF